MAIGEFCGVDVMTLAKIMGVDLAEGGTLTAVDPFPFPAVTSLDSSFSSSLIDAATEKVGFIFTAPKTGTIDRLCFRTGTVTTGTTLDIRLETVNTAGEPSGSLVAANTNGAQVVADANDNVWFETTLTAGASVTKGQVLALVVANSGLGNLNIVSLGLTASSWLGTPPYVNLFTTSWSAAARCPVGAVRYSDATYPVIPGGYLPATGVTSVSVHAGTTPDEIGNVFIPNVDCKVSGMWLSSSGWATGDAVDLVLYDSGSSALATAAVVAGFNATNPPRIGMFSSEITLAAGSTYRAIIKGVAAAGVNAHDVTLDASAKGSMQGYTSWAMWKTSRTNAGAWSNDDTHQIACGLIVSAISDSGT